ncbi:peptidylprolyl isomerase [Caviibacterium pharyngocola]|uniref:Periplasmic chaperone PpiD n=1 Tax=Caviibacterium pharyngocola TaxID=28159 RepID=A0A2M8RSM3_9PAST|nr:peptidylprolyl isomerase [Caviibacterium pharyngocola]PJG81889.1 peptidylprolyl isomerase [Caviibacterium pharyngocola]
MLMEKLNGASNSILWKLIFGLIAVSFVLSGVAGYVFTQVDTSAAKVNGEEISQQTFQQQYNDEYQRLSQQLGAQFAAVADSPEFINGLRKNVLNRLIDQELLRQYASELKLDVSDAQITQEIVTSPAFQNDGKFDNRLYQQMLSSNGLNGEMYAQYVREGLRLEQLQSGFAASDFVVPAQAENLAKLFFQQRSVRLATLPLANELAQQTVTEQEIQQYYESNKAAFIVPESVKVQYIDLTAAVAQKNVNVTDVEIAQYYQDNKSQYMTQRLAHIQLASEKEAQAVYADLQKGEDFALLAKLYSTDKISGAKGGDLNWVSAGTLPTEFEIAAAKLDVGQYSQPVKVDNAYHIIKVQDVKTRSLDEVKNDIAAKIRNDLAANEFYALEKRVNEKAFEDQSSLNAAAQAAGVKVEETDYFTRKDIPQALNFANLVSTVFDSDVSQGGTNSEAINVGDQHSIVVRVVDHKAEGTKSLDEAKAEITAYLTHQKAEKAVLENAEKIARTLVENPNTALPENVKFGETEVRVFAENKDPVLDNAIFAMAKPTDKPSYSAAKTSDNNVVLIELNKVEDGNLSAEQLQQFNAQLAQARQAELYHSLLNALRDKAKIEVNNDFMNQE